MIIEELVNNKVVTLEILEDSFEILNLKGFFITSSFGFFEKYLTVNKLKNGDLNTYICIRVITNKHKEFEHENLYLTSSLSELLETLLIQYKLESRFEVCKVLNDFLNNIYS